MANPDMKIVSMERTKAEKKAAEERCKAMPCDTPDYPWGLNINLGKEELDKLGMKDLPAVGDEMHIYAVCCVTRVSQSASKDGPDSKGVELQITHMGSMIEDEDKPQSAYDKLASKLYSGAERAEGE